MGKIEKKMQMKNFWKAWRPSHRNIPRGMEDPMRLEKDGKRRQEQTQNLENFNFTEPNPTDKMYADVEDITVSDKTMTGSVEFENFENIVQTTSLEEAGREEAAKVSKLKKKEDIEAKKHENEQSHGQTHVHSEGQAGGGQQHRDGGRADKMDL